jgi:hypothetical protein
MPLANYGLVTGTLIDHGPRSVGNPHYILVVQSKRSRYRIAINIESAESSGSVLPELEYRIINDMNTEGRKAKAFAARIKGRAAAEHAFTLKAHDPRLPTLDYVRDGAITMKKFRTLARGIHPGKNAFHKTLFACGSPIGERQRVFHRSARNRIFEPLCPREDYTSLVTFCVIWLHRS